MEERYIACFDFGGSSLKTAVCKKDGTIVTKKMYPMCDTLDDFLCIIQTHVEELKRVYELEGIAISSCGAVDCESTTIGGMSALPFIHGPSWKALILKHTGLPCEIENDANCAALSELYFGKAKQMKDMAFMVIGTGVGGAIVLNRKIHHGHHLFGGEFGMFLMKDREDQYINYSLIASTSSMVRKMELIQPGRWDGSRIFEKAEEGNAACKQVIDQFYDNIALGVFNIQHILDPEIILFGGAISARLDFKEQVLKAYEKLSASLKFDVLTPKVECCTYKQDANILGALAHYIQRHGE